MTSDKQAQIIQRALRKAEIREAARKEKADTIRKANIRVLDQWFRILQSVDLKVLEKAGADKIYEMLKFIDKNHRLMTLAVSLYGRVPFESLTTEQLQMALDQLAVRDVHES